MRDIKEFSAQDLQRRLGEVQDAALVAPIAITHRGRRRHVMMSIDEFKRLERAASARAYRIGDLPADLAEDLSNVEMDSRHDHLDKLLD
ncbi:type II toxin-antitoxin system Phd/YefM family antitoxin [Bradyrhizobium sp. 138]|uniref:type II toxin-antitoxin system prevent-host-death family antitoxin n=1 Tax=Bradyrhizobium sp. 138 TaxID=2782615 RepID=UPI0021115797|nr:type II toxin-antitoxin system prevent-host-death family antitoxin [Bradyrhizobium sp. 138]MCK1735158.1 type II toxin-antitoxin system Phd/YefM family antitoxin [Bradyrhizobium sp. 138]